MDNDDEMKAVSVLASGGVHEEVARLLEEELEKISLGEKRDSFRIETEFAKTKKNGLRFSWKNMWLGLLICFAVVCAITVSLMVFFSRSNRSLVVEVNEFENLNLSSLLTKVSNIDQKIMDFENEKRSLEEERKAEIERIEENHAASLKNLAAMNIKNKKVREEQEQQIEDEYQADLASLEKYNKLIANCNEELKSYEAQRSEFDASRVQEAQRQKAALSSERLLHEKEKERIIDDYEQKLEDARENLKQTQIDDLKRQEELLAFTINQYDPEIPKSERIRRLLKAYENYPVVYDVVLRSDEGEEIPIAEDASPEFKDVFDSQRQIYGSIGEFHSFLNQMPFREGNAVSNFVSAMERYAIAAGNQIAASSITEVNRFSAEKKALEDLYNLLQSEYENLSQKYNTTQKQLTKYDDVFESLCAQPVAKTPADGIVIATSSSTIELYVRKDKQAVFDSQGGGSLAFSCSLWNGKTKIADAKVSPSTEVFFVTDIEIKGKSQPQVGDKVLFGERILP